MKTPYAILLVVIAEILVAILGVAIYGFTIEGLQATTRFSGRLSLLIFSFIFLLHPKEKPVLSFYLSGSYFLVFAIAHGIHLAELLSYVALSGIKLVPYRLMGGFAAYLMIFLMPWFQSRHNGGKLGLRAFTGLGYVYLFYVWFVFFMTYVSRVSGSFPNAGGSRSEHLTLIGWVVVMLIIKIGRFFIKKRLSSP